MGLRRIVAGLARGLVLLAVLPGSLPIAGETSAAPVAQVAGALPVGSSAWVSGTGSASLRVHTAPLLSSDVIGTLSPGAPVLVLEGPVGGDGADWYRVNSTALPRSGWVDGQFLSAAPPPPAAAGAGLAIGHTAWVAGTGTAGLVVRSAPLLSSQQIESLSEGMAVLLLEGPVAGDGLNWYRVSSPALTGSGWVDAEFLSPTPPASSAPPAPSGALTIGASAWVRGTGGIGLRVRSGPQLASPQVGSLNDGTEVQLLTGPVAADGYNWYQVSAPNLPSPGWVVSGALSPTPP